MTNAKNVGLQQIYQELKLKIDQFADGTLTAAQLKPFTAPFGVYEQRNLQFMVRIRITGGHITAAALREVASLMERNHVGYAHLSSRQDIQLHDVAVDKVYSTIIDCDGAGMPFKGGGGNTYRNILVSPDSGFSPDQIFDVSPYARKLNEILRCYEKAFSLPRKLKIGFYAIPAEESNAAIQDLGFAAVIQDGRRGFKVYGGGGMGRDSALGVKLFDFIPADQVARCAVAMTDMFYDHGDRSNHSRARIRFIIQNIGAEAFVKLFMEYFDKADAEAIGEPTDIDYTPPARNHSGNETPADGFAVWREHAATATRHENCSAVRLYVPYGNLNAEQLRQTAKLADDFGNGFIRLLQSQDFLLAPVPNAALTALHRRLLSDFDGLDLTLLSFKGHILSCIGASVCKIGVVSAPELTDIIAAQMDACLPADTPQKLQKLRLLTSQVRVSGCLNSCSGHPAAKIGVQGHKQRIDGNQETVGIIFSGASDDPESMCLSKTIPGAPAVKAADLPAKIDSMLNALIEK